jgi:hypothetical protein
MTEGKKTIYRDSKTGQITDKKYADHHPATTEKERVSTGKPAPKK